jgi:hypothetical protein
MSLLGDIRKSGQHQSPRQNSENSEMQSLQDHALWYIKPVSGQEKVLLWESSQMSASSMLLTVCSVNVALPCTISGISCSSIDAASSWSCTMTSLSWQRC